MPLPAWLTPLPDAQSMRDTDRWAIEERGIDSGELMEAAGAGLTRVVEAQVPDGPIAVICGKGNNGGDGLVAARMLREAGREIVVLAGGDLRESTEDVRANLERLPGDAPRPYEDTELDERFQGCVDALLGTGFSGEPRGPVGSAIARLNKLDVPVISADVPSGVDASTGEAADQAVHAAATVTFHTAKPGLWINPGKAHAGEIHVIDIGIPRGAPQAAAVGLMGSGVIGSLPRRGAASTKFVSGHVLVCGGSRGLTGAPCLASESAARAGAGYVTACVPASLQSIFETRLLEVMTRGLPDEDGALVREGAGTVLEAASRGALALGPGLGREEGTVALARTVARGATVALVLDADGLYAHSGRLEDLAGREAPTVLTPHAGELGRLLEVDSQEIESRRLHHVREAAARAGAIVVLKGDDTLVADPQGRVAVSPGGSPALATAGTGDVLTGVVAAMLAPGLDPFLAASAAVWLHAEAGRLAAERQGSVEGVIASDVIAALPAALGRP